MAQYKLDPDLAQKVADSAIELIREVALEHLTKLEPGTPLVIYYKQEQLSEQLYQAVGFLREFKAQDETITLSNGVDLYTPWFIDTFNNHKIEIPKKDFLGYNVLTTKIVTAKEE